MDVAVIDIDGTLLDSNYHHAIAWSRAFAHVGHDVAVWRIHRHIGMGGDRLVAAVAGQVVEDRDGDSIRERWEKEYDELIDQTRLLDGAAELLDGLRDAGLQVVLASSSIPRHADHALRLLDAEHRAAAWTTSEDVEESKPDPELIDRALDKVGAAPADALMIGDTVWDVLPANERAMPTIGLLCGGFGRDELLDAGARATYDDPRDLLDHLGDALDL
ncbi:MAG TPA: HAD family hydrolase [Marmoricola sp.]|jgi:HAD superfamily hydrolase (TIGR01549 family)|nr:HAD family hydrolase [Marmoricola sp.]